MKHCYIDKTFKNCSVLNKNLPSQSSTTMHAEALAAAGMFVRSCRVTATLWQSSIDSTSATLKLPANSKIVHFVRHGQGYHNLMDQVAKESGAEFSDVDDYDLAVQEKRFYLKPELQDPPLTAKGLVDAKRLSGLVKHISPELLIVSPLKRATQTIAVGFHEHIRRSPQTPMLALESCREQFGIYYSDKRSSVEDLQIEFPFVNYERMTDSEDVVWKPKARETMLEMCHRQNEFLNILASLPQKEIVVGSHSAWLYSLFNIVLEVDEADKHTLQPMFVTGELRSVLLTIHDN